ncbi:MAG TPA: hypothetical protein ENK18_26335 [Deltaproteobacteria bacterium]|nr:hypothetical protein [Deltaproteobacteria bacterium]
MWMLGIGGALAGAAPQGAEQVIGALSMRHAVPCAEVEALTPVPVPALLYVVEQVARPPWAPMRAAVCLLEGHASEIEAQLQLWVTSPELLGLGRLVLGRLPVLPVPTAVELARRALSEGPEPERARATLARSEVIEVRALLSEP